MNNSCEIISIESDSQQVRIDFRYINCHGTGGWVGIAPKCFIRPVGSDTILTMTKTEGMPIIPDKLSFQQDGDVLYYALFFPPLQVNVTEIDIIEDANDTDSFNFYCKSLLKPNLSLTKSEIPVLKNIEQIALELKGDNKNQRSYFHFH